MEQKRVFQVCSKCGHVQAVNISDNRLRWKCSNYGCGRVNDIKTEINMKPMEVKT